MPFWPICCESDAILFKKFGPGDRAGVFIWENFHPSYRDIGRKNRDLSNRASPASHMNTSIFLQRIVWRGEILETVPARLRPLVSFAAVIRVVTQLLITAAMETTSESTRL